MLQCACEFQKNKQIIWWLHESSFFYPGIFRTYPQYRGYEIAENTRVLAVSNVAKRCFEKYYPDRVNGILPVAVPDMALSEKKDAGENCIFVYVGEFLPYKGVTEIIDAFSGAIQNGLENAELWLVGKHYGNEYGDEILRKTKDNTRIRLCGVLSQKDLEQVYSEMDALICASPEETLSITCIDAMRNEKPCIVSRGAGISEYLKDNENALIFTPGDVEELTRKMVWVANNRDEARNMGKQARTAYLENFTYDIFVKRIHDILNV